MAGMNDFDVGSWLNEELTTGTSLMCVEFDGGVVMGADSRTTMGSYVENRVSDKLTMLSDRICACRSGSTADTQAVAHIVKTNLNMNKYAMNETPTVKTAANMVKNICYKYREQLMAGVIVGGYDEKKGGQVYMIPLGGMCVRMPVATGGSGSTFIYGYVDSTYREGMTKEECLRFTATGLALAMARDGSSGGIIRLAAITKDGVERHTLIDDQIPKVYEG